MTPSQPVWRVRSQVLQAIRRFFTDRDFLEVETPVRIPAPALEAHIDAVPSGAGFLRTSPELHMKRLLAEGCERVFQMGPCFRRGEKGRFHNPEFTMLEWYRAREPYAAVMDDSLELLRLAAGTSGAKLFSFRGRTCDPCADAERLTVADAFDRLAGIDLMATLSDKGEGDREALAAQARRSGFEVADNDCWADIFSKLLIARVEPRLGLERPTLLFEYPRCEAALARATPHDPRLAERFELYVCGVELANGFGELTDPVEQRARFEAEMNEKERIYGERYPLDEDFLAALAHMPEACGVALGFDRLVMLAVGARNLDDVIWIPTP